MDALIIFAKFPEPGKVKTRLAADIGEEQASSLYRELLLEIVEEHTAASYTTFVYFSPPEQEAGMRELLGDISLVPQVGKDLGERMYNAIHSLEDKYENIIIVGSDLPDLTQDKIEEAFIALKDHDVVIGPAHDGGYYLIGMHRAHPIFSDIKWSTDSVYGATLVKILSLQLSYKMLETRRDLDTIEDLRALKEKSNKYGDLIQKYLGE